MFPASLQYDQKKTHSPHKGMEEWKRRETDGIPLSTTSPQRTIETLLSLLSLSLSLHHLFVQFAIFTTPSLSVTLSGKAGSAVDKAISK